MSEHQHRAMNRTARERELEIEVARLRAELDTLRGDDPSAATSRFLAMAAATVDRAVEDARREADEIVEEVSAQAEARRDEATRVAAEAEAMAEVLLADADRAQERIDAANEEAEAIKAAAGEEADALVQSEREKVAVEIEALADVRTALEEERGALERYHETLRSRVQELAETMVTFMSTELPGGAESSIESLVTPQLESVIAASPSPATAVEGTDLGGDDAADESEAIDEREEVAELDGEGAAAVDEHETWTALLESAIPSDEAYPDAVDMPDDAIGEIPDGPPREFAGQEILEPELDDERPSSAGLFSRATADESVAEDPADEEHAESRSAGLIGMLGALDAEEAEDHAFHEFLAGDDEPDPSRDWLLRPEKS